MGGGATRKRVALAGVLTGHFLLGSVWFVFFVAVVDGSGLTRLIRPPAEQPFVQK